MPNQFQNYIKYVVDLYSYLPMHHRHFLLTEHKYVDIFPLHHRNFLLTEHEYVILPAVKDWRNLVGESNTFQH